MRSLALLAMLCACAVTGCLSQPVVLSPLKSQPVSLPLLHNVASNFTLDLWDVSGMDLSRVELVVQSNQTCEATLLNAHTGEACDTIQPPFPGVARGWVRLCQQGWVPRMQVQLSFLAHLGSCTDMVIYAQLSPVVSLTRAGGVQWSTDRFVPGGNMFFVWAEPDPEPGSNGTVRPFAVVISSLVSQFAINYLVTPSPSSTQAGASLNWGGVGGGGVPAYLDSNARPSGTGFGNGGFGAPLVAPVLISTCCYSITSAGGMAFAQFNVSVLDESAIPLALDQPSTQPALLAFGVSTIFEVALNATGPTELLVTLTSGAGVSVYWSANGADQVGHLPSMQLDAPSPIQLPQAATPGEEWTLVFTSDNGGTQGQIVMQWANQASEAEQEEEEAAMERLISSA